MPIFETRLQNVKVTFSPFSTDQMMTIAEVVLDHIKARIQSVQDVTDSRAKPLKETYAEEKRKGRFVALGGPRRYSGLPYRDWTLRGRTMQGLKVKFASQERATIGATSEETGKILGARNRVDNMWGISPSDGAALQAVVLATLRQSAAVRVELMGYGKAKAA
jgi:hypothetical protein